jgi:hypothetical protein
MEVSSLKMMKNDDDTKKTLSSEYLQAGAASA